MRYRQDGRPSEKDGESDEWRLVRRRERRNTSREWAVMTKWRRWRLQCSGVKEVEFIYDESNIFSLLEWNHSDSASTQVLFYRTVDLLQQLGELFKLKSFFEFINFCVSYLTNLRIIRFFSSQNPLLKALFSLLDWAG